MPPNSMDIDGVGTRVERAPRHILAIGKYYPPSLGGTEANMHDICSMLAQTHRVTAVVYNHERGSTAAAMDRVKVVRCGPEIVISNQPIALSMFKEIDLSTVDLVHFHGPNFFANAVLLIKLMVSKKKVPVIVTHHMEVHGRKLLRLCVVPLYRSLVRRSKAVIVTSIKNAKHSKDLPSGAPTVAIPLGVDVADFEPSAAQRAEAVAWKMSLIGDSPSVCFVGRHARYKGLDVLIDVIKDLPGVHCFIAGGGPYKEAAIAQATDLGLTDRVHFLGYLSEAEKRRLLVASDVFAFPSTEVTEAFGISQLEAMAARIPVVASDLPTGVTDVAIHEETALLAAPHDRAGLKRCISRLLDDKEFAKGLTERAWRHVSDHFSRDLMLARTKDLIECHLYGANECVSAT